MWQMVIVAVDHLLILFLALFGLRLSHRYMAGKFIRFHVHCPTQLAAQGQYEAPPCGWSVLYLGSSLFSVGNSTRRIQLA